MKRFLLILLSALLVGSPPAYAELGDDMLPSTSPTGSHRYLIRGEYDREETLDSAAILAERVELENKTILGDLVIDSMVGEGPVDLKNVSIQGSLIINGGQEITLNGVTASNLIVNSPDTQVELTIRGKSEIPSAQVTTPLSIKETMLSSGYGGLVSLETSAESNWFTLPIDLDYCRLDSLVINTATEISGTGNCKVDVLEANRNLTLSGVSVEESSGLGTIRDGDDH